MKQEKILARLRSVYVDHSFEQLAAVTSIQRTRLYRLYRGSEMKLSEYESIKKAIWKRDNLDVVRWQKLVDECFEQLGRDRLKIIEDWIQSNLSQERYRSRVREKLQGVWA